MYNPLEFIRWEQVAALAIIVFGAVITLWIRKLSNVIQETKKTAEETNVVAKENQESSYKITKTLTETNSGTHVKDQLNRLEVKLSQINGVFENNKDIFAYMRRNFKHPEYFEELESSLDDIRFRLQQIDRTPGRSILRQRRATHLNLRRNKK